MKTPKLFKKYISPLVTIENKTKNQTNKKQTWRTLPPSLEKKNESKIKKLKSVLEKNVRKKNVSKELRTYLKKTLEKQLHTINLRKTMSIWSSLNVWKLKSIVLEKKE